MPPQSQLVPDDVPLQTDEDKNDRLSDLLKLAPWNTRAIVRVERDEVSKGWKFTWN